jgi:hypothetical protein
MKITYSGFASSLVLMASLAAGAQQAAAPADLEAQAQTEFAQRAYSNAGVQSALAAAGHYTQAAQVASDKVEKSNDLALAAAAYYFAGGAVSDNTAKKDHYLKGIAAASQALALYGVNDVRNVSDQQKSALKALPAQQLAIVQEALYQRGTNLGQWGQANGVASSLGKWPELKDNMQLVIDLGGAANHQYGAYRTLGFGYYKIPGLLGGSAKKADQYLSIAVSKTLAPGQTYSVDGYNNTFYAQILNGAGQTQKAKDLLVAFIKADPATLLPGYAQENRQAQLEAADLLKSW